MNPIDQNPNTLENNAMCQQPCSACKAARTAGAKFCPQCGLDLSAIAARIVPTSASTIPTSPQATAISRSVNPPPTANSPVSSGQSHVQMPSRARAPIAATEEVTCACGRVLPDDPRFCPGCGIQIGADPSSGYFLTAVGNGEPPTPLTGFEFIVGKDAACDLVIPDDEYVSRRHARIRMEDGFVYLEDLGSSNGTLLRIRRAVKLEAGDELLIGTQVMRLEKRP